MSLNRITRHRLFWPAAVLLALLLANLAFTPDFFAIRIKDGHLYGSLIDILHFGSPLILVALGMTLVIATGGIDLSVGSTVAIAGALACLHISQAADPGSPGTVLTAVGIALGVAVLLGGVNGLLVARIGVQPIIATLILMVAGRGVAQLITDGQIITITSEPYKLIGGGYWLTVPFSILLAGAVVPAGLGAHPAHRARTAAGVGRRQPRWPAAWSASGRPGWSGWSTWSARSARPWPD
ncbi:hypothetical protein GCM10020229_71600 [Kitasatospora albolonga]